MFDIPQNGDEDGRHKNPAPSARPENVGRNKLAQFRHRGSAFAVGLPELRKLVPAYGPTGLRVSGIGDWREDRDLTGLPDGPVEAILCRSGVPVFTPMTSGRSVKRARSFVAGN